MSQRYKRYMPLDFEYNLDSRKPKYKACGLASGYISMNNMKNGLLYRFVEKKLGIITPPFELLQDAQNAFFELIDKTQRNLLGLKK